MGVNVTLVHNAGVVEAAVTVLSTLITIVPVALIIPQPPVNGIV